MYSVLNWLNVAKLIEFSLWELRFYVTFIGNAGCFKWALQWYSKCYGVASVTKTFTLKEVQTIHRLAPWTFLNILYFWTFAPDLMLLWELWKLWSLKKIKCLISSSIWIPQCLTASADAVHEGSLCNNRSIQNNIKALNFKRRRNYYTSNTEQLFIYIYMFIYLYYFFTIFIIIMLYIYIYYNYIILLFIILYYLYINTELFILKEGTL
jgi:hypothetical protein